VIVAEVDALARRAGKILPKDKLGLVAFMETLDVAESTIEFGEGDKKEKKPTRDWLRGFLKTLPKAVEFNERGARTGADGEPAPIRSSRPRSSRARGGVPGDREEGRPHRRHRERRRAREGAGERLTNPHTPRREHMANPI
jgi:hypothetical protein